MDDMLAVNERINECNTLQELQRLIFALTAAWGIDYFLAGTMPPQNSTMEIQISNVLLGEWPEEWSKRYFANGYLELDPTISHTRFSQKGIRWENLSHQNNVVMEEAREFKLNEGFTIPMLSVDGIKVGMSFAGEKISKCPEAKMSYLVIASSAVARALEITRKENFHKEIAKQITPAEFKCLRWLCEGKTSWEIGVIEGISQRTVEKHVASSMHKTNSCNRIQLVANALRLGLLS
ncbi:MAG: helix-turn-helix transcriptional regulator [Rhizobiaceae bacterium]